MMKSLHVLLVLLSMTATQAGMPCPLSKEIFPCFCIEDSKTFILCPMLKNSTHMAAAMKPLKSLVVDRLLLVNTFMSDLEEHEALINTIEPPQSKVGMFPNKWLAELRVKHLEIDNAYLNGYFLNDEALEGQSDFLLSISIKNTNLGGHLTSSCSPKPDVVTFCTKELRRTPMLKVVDFSYNMIQVINGLAFPPLKGLTHIDLSNNLIQVVHDNAFNNINLQYLDLSKNQLTVFNRKIFQKVDTNLGFLDLSHNSIQSLPTDVFTGMNALKEIKLSYNRLETLPGAIWGRVPSTLEKADLKGNFLVCNCSMNWMHTRSARTVKFTGHCVAPESVEFQEVKSNLASIKDCS